MWEWQPSVAQLIEVWVSGTCMVLLGLTHDFEMVWVATAKVEKASRAATRAAWGPQNLFTFPPTSLGRGVSARSTFFALFLKFRQNEFLTLECVLHVFAFVVFCVLLCLFLSLMFFHAVQQNFFYVCRWRQLMECDGRMNSCLLLGLKWCCDNQEG